MATVMHGRRKGEERASPEMQLHGEGSAGMQLHDGTDLRQITVLSKGDWDRIQQQLHRKQIEEERMRRVREEKEEQKQRSKEIVKNWGNTIAGQRHRKLEARKLREQKEEEERVQIDLEEAQFQALQRKEAIEKAKTQQYYQTDRVKNFHGALMLTEVLKEREAQLELKALKDRASIGQDRVWQDRAQREYEEAIQKDQNKARERIKAATENADFQKAQLREHLRANDLEQQEDLKEGSELKKLSIQHQIERERLENIRKDEKQSLMLENMVQIRDRQTLKELQQTQEEEEDEECRIFAAAKRKMMKLRGEKESQIHIEKQKHLEQIREKLSAQMKQKYDDEDSRIREAVEEAEAKRAKEDAEKEEKMKKMMAESGAHRHKQMKEQEGKKKEGRREELEVIRIRQAADEIFRRNEEEKIVRKRAEAEDLKGFHRKQAEDKLQLVVEGKHQQLALDKANQQLLALEEDQFQEYAQKVIDHCEKGGRNVYPLQKAAVSGGGGGKGPIFHGKGGIRPSYMVSDKSGKQMPNYQKDSTEETKHLIAGSGKTKKRLGFVW